MPTSVPVPTKNPGDVILSSLWNSYVRDNVNKLLDRGHRTLTVAQFAALTGLEGTRGTVAGDEVYLEVDATNGVLWHLVYESTEATYKWRCVGGPPLRALVSTEEVVGASSTWVNLATVGPDIVVPRSGDYNVHAGVHMLPVSTAQANVGVANASIGTTPIDMTGFLNGATSQRISTAFLPKINISAGQTLRMQYFASAAHFFGSRVIYARPTRLI